MIDFVVQPQFIDAILALVALEAVAIVGFRALRGAGPAPLGLLCTLFAGAFLLLALRHALAGASPLLIAGCLALAGVIHLADLALRWNGAPMSAAQSTIGKQTAIAQARPKAAPSAPGRGSHVRA
jgi:hypothetical protein